MNNRPDPDELLERVMAEEARACRGKLKIFFGASAGVGKTYAMLSAAQQQRKQGIDVVVGIVETHGRAETAALLQGLDILPLREIEYRDRSLREFDLDGALARKPALLLVDELAHSNVEGARHPKRWQDVEELLDAGIDVFTTVNVQHIESLNDVVGGITGIRVWETVPDHVFDAADEVVIVDLAPDDLLQRLREGKVYMPQQAERAIRNFFRKGNLIALRELALRRTADRVDDEMREYRREQAVEPVWGAREALLVCIGPDAGDEKVVRGAARLAAKLNARWHAVYIETPKLQRLGADARRRILKSLQLAQELGADTATLPGNDVAQAVVDYARSHNLAQVLIGRSPLRVWRFWRRTLADRIGALAPDIATLQIARTDISSADKGCSTQAGAGHLSEAVNWRHYALSAGICALTLLMALPLLRIFDIANIIMVFLLGVVLVALRYGRGPAVMAAFLNVAAFDFFFVPPRFSFAVSDVQYLLTFAIMLGVALLTGQLTAHLKYQARVAINRELRAGSLYEMARELSAALLVEQVRTIASRYVEGNFRARVTLILADADNQLIWPADAVATIDVGIAQWAFDHAAPAGLGTDTLPSSAALYLPLLAPMRARGVLAVLPQAGTSQRWLLIPEQRRLLDTFAALIAIAVERVHYVDIAQQTTVQIESERLRNSLLSTLSHDLRTPLTTLMGFAEFLTLTKPALGDEQREVALSIYREAQRMTALVNNLLDMSRLQAGEIKLNREWQPLDEVVGAVLVALRVPLARHVLQTRLPADLPLVEFDAVLMERVLSNLIENAAKYTPPGSEIRIAARVDGDELEIVVADDGPGLPVGMEEEIFKKFTRGQSEGNTPGVGLGLAICRAIIAAHGGRIYAERAQPHGARFIIRLPLGQPPPLHEPPTIHHHPATHGLDREG
ncbi:MAG: two-component system sensor histidine kinase KdpD [Spongiibacteraceae bacterium]